MNLHPIFQNAFVRVTLFFICCLLTVGTSNAQGPSSGSPALLVNCFQTFPYSTTSSLTYKALATSGFMFLYGGESSSWPDYIGISSWDEYGVGPLGFDYGLSGLSDAIYTVQNNSVYGTLVSALEYDVSGSEFVPNSNTFTIEDGTTKVEVTFYYWNGQPSNQTLELSSETVTLEFVNPNEAFSFNTYNEDGCFTFDDFNVEFSTILDNFCGQFSEATIQIIPPVEAGWSTSFSQTFTNPASSNVVGTPNTWCDDECLNVSAPYTIPDPVPCGCHSFELYAVFEPCNTDPAYLPEGCEELIVNETIDICCDCDVRESGPSN